MTNLAHFLEIARSLRAIISHSEIDFIVHLMLGETNESIWKGDPMERTGYYEHPSQWQLDAKEVETAARQHANTLQSPCRNGSSTPRKSRRHTGRDGSSTPRKSQWQLDAKEVETRYRIWSQWQLDAKEVET